MEDWLMIRQLYKKGVSVSELSRMTGMSRNTVRKYAQIEKYPHYKRVRSCSSKLNPYKGFIDGKLAEAAYTAKRLYREIADKGYTGSYPVVQRYVRKVRSQLSTKAVWRFETEPGEQSQVDWGEFGKVIISGVEYWLHCFFMILGYSRIKYIEFTTYNDTDTLIRCHMNAFDYLGGHTRSILYDNLKQVIIKRMYDMHDSKLNPKFLDFCGYYGFKPRFCRPYRAKTKGKVENTVKYVRYGFFMGQTFSSLEELNNKARIWLNQINSQVHGTTKEVPFDRLRSENLLPIKDLPPFDLVKSLLRKVSPECYVHYQGNRYSVPHKFAGYQVELVVNDNELQVHYGKEILCSHEQLNGINKTSKNKEHFSGLLKMLRDENAKPYRKNGIIDCDSFATDVEKRALKVYDEIGGIDNGKSGI